MCCSDMLSVFTHLVSKYVYAIAHCILILFIIVNMILIAILGISKVNIFLYLILLFLTIILAILGGVFICYSGRQDPDLKGRINGLIIFALIITILLLVFTIVEEIKISHDFSEKKKDSNIQKCLDYLKNEEIKESIKICVDYYFFTKVKDYTYFKFTYIEIVSIISILFWLQNKKKNEEQIIPPINIPLNAGIPNSYDINSATNNNIYMASPGQQYNSNYYPAQQNMQYIYNPVPLNNNYQGQQYVQNNVNVNNTTN